MAPQLVENCLGDIAKRYVGTNENGTLEDTDLRLRLANHLMDEKAHKLTIRRIMAEAKGNVEVTAVASILKNSATDVAQSRTELLMELWEPRASAGKEKNTVVMN